MKDLVKKYNYYIPNQFKEIDKSKYQYSTFSFAGVEWKLHDIDLKNISKFNTHNLSSFNIEVESKSSLNIEGVNKNTVPNLDQYVESLNEARDYLSSVNRLTKEDINKVYLIASNNEKFIDKDNIPLKGKSLFRTNDIFIGGQKAIYVGKKLEEYVSDLCELINELLDSDKSYYAAIYLHFFFEHLHPLPDYNGRVGRLLLSWCLSKLFDNAQLSNYISNNKQDYYKSISLTETHKDLTYSTIFFTEAVAVNLEFDNLFNNEKSDKYEAYSSLNDAEQQALFNLFSRREKFAWNEYSAQFGDTRSKSQLHLILSNLEKKGLIKSTTYSNNLKRYYYE